METCYCDLCKKKIINLEKEATYLGKGSYVHNKCLEEFFSDTKPKKKEKDWWGLENLTKEEYEDLIF